MDGMYKEFNAEHWKLSSVVIRKSKQTRKILYRKVHEESAEEKCTSEMGRYFAAQRRWFQRTAGSRDFASGEIYLQQARQIGMDCQT